MSKVCAICGQCINDFTAVKYRNELICSDCYHKIKKDVKNEIKRVKKTAFYIGGIYFDDADQQILYESGKNIGKRPYRDIVSYHPINEGRSEVTENTLSRAVVDGALLGDISALKGAKPSSKQYKYVEKLAVDITFNDGSNFEDVIVKDSKGNIILNEAGYKAFNNLCAKLDAILQQNNDK